MTGRAPHEAPSHSQLAPAPSLGTSTLSQPTTAPRLETASHRQKTLAPWLGTPSQSRESCVCVLKSGKWSGKFRTSDEGPRAARAALAISADHCALAWDFLAITPCPRSRQPRNVSRPRRPRSRHPRGEEGGWGGAGRGGGPFYASRRFFSSWQRCTSSSNFWH